MTVLFDEIDPAQAFRHGAEHHLIELKTFGENLTCDCSFITHHTVAANLTGPDFLQRKDKIIAALDHAIHHGDLDRMAAIRRNKKTL